MTNLHGGWAAGAATLQPHAKEAALARVILLSDGNANVGTTGCFALPPRTWCDTSSGTRSEPSDFLSIRLYLYRDVIDRTIYHRW